MKDVYETGDMEEGQDGHNLAMRDGRELSNLKTLGNNVLVRYHDLLVA